MDTILKFYVKAVHFGAFLNVAVKQYIHTSKQTGLAVVMPYKLQVHVINELQFTVSASREFHSLTALQQ